MDMLRTKYIEEIEADAVGVTPTTAEGRPFGAQQVIYAYNGTKLSGTVGSGFSREQMTEIPSVRRESFGSRFALPPRGSPRPAR